MGFPVIIGVFYNNVSETLVFKNQLIKTPFEFMTGLLNEASDVRDK